MQSIWVPLSEDMPSVIVTYNTQQLTMLGAMFTYNGTILDSSFTWMQAAFLQILAWGFVGFFHALDMKSEDLSADNINDAIKIINAVLAFALGMYVSISISRYVSMHSPPVFVSLVHHPDPHPQHFTLEKSGGSKTGVYVNLYCTPCPFQG